MAKPEAKSYTLSHYGAKDEDSSPVEAAYEPKSHAAILEGWEGVQGVELSMHTQEDADTPLWIITICQPQLELSTKRGMLWQELC